MIDSRFGWVINCYVRGSMHAETGDSWEEAFEEKRSSYHRNT